MMSAVQTVADVFFNSFFYGILFKEKKKKCTSKIFCIVGISENLSLAYIVLLCNYVKLKLFKLLKYYVCTRI